jgi:hypothetical protein
MASSLITTSTAHGKGIHVLILEKRQDKNQRVIIDVVKRSGIRGYLLDIDSSTLLVPFVAQIQELFDSSWSLL